MSADCELHPRESRDRRGHTSETFIRTFSFFCGCDDMSSVERQIYRKTTFIFCLTAAEKSSRSDDLKKQNKKN